jgi:hypothetical protein
MNANDFINGLQIFYAHNRIPSEMTPAKTQDTDNETVITDPQYNGKRSKGNVD